MIQELFHKLRLFSCVVAYVAFVPVNASAEGNCPSGYYPIGGGNGGWQGCAPMSSGAGGAPPNPGPQWATRWGAIAHDGKLGRFGGAEGFTAKRKAEKAAIAECRKNGGKSCKIKISYYNQCGAMAWGNNLMVVSRGPEREATIEDAVDSCNKDSSNCQPYYAGCSYPERVR